MWIQREKKIVTKKKAKPFVFDPVSQRVENIYFEIPYTSQCTTKPRVVFLKTITLTISHPRIRDTFPIDQFLPSHAHFQGHMGWEKIVHPAKVVFSVYVYECVLVLTYFPISKNKIFK